jgi:hypothetical protein
MSNVSRFQRDRVAGTIHVVASGDDAASGLYANDDEVPDAASFQLLI